MERTSRALRTVRGGRTGRSLLAVACTAAATWTGIVAGQAPAGAATFVVPPSIDATGTANVSTELQAFFAGVPDGSTIQLPAGARYRSDGTLTLTDRHNLTFEGNGATFFATVGTGDRVRRHWAIRGGSGITFRNLTVKGANPVGGTSEAAYQAAMEAQHGFDFGGVDGVELDRVTVTDVYGDFVYLGKQMDSVGAWTSHVWIHDSTFARNGRQGISVTGAQDVRIERNHIGQTRRATFDIEPNGPGWGVRRLTITDNDVGRGRLLFVAATGSGPAEDITISGNRLTGRAMQSTFKPPVDARRSNLRFTDNVSNTPYGNPAGAAVYVLRTTNVTVTGNVQPIQAGRGMTGVEVRDDCGTEVSGNTFVNAVTESRVKGTYACP